MTVHFLSEMIRLPCLVINIEDVFSYEFTGIHESMLII